jgi:hypothetical protein
MERFQGYVGLREYQGKLVARIRINFCEKSLLKVNPYFKHFSSILVINSL